MIITCVYIQVIPETVDFFIEATRANHHESVNEPGNIRFDFLQQEDDPCRFMIYEVYESQQAAVAHKSTAHYLKWRDTVQEFMAEPRKGIRYNAVEPEDRSGW